MKTIWKYKLDNLNKNIKLPKYANVLSTAVVDGEVYIWVEFDLKFEKTLVSRTFEIYGTGFEKPDGDYIFIGTVFKREYVWHIFERLN